MTCPRMPRAWGAALAATAAMWAGAPSATAQLRVVTWNISNYDGGRTADLQTSIYGVNGANGQTMAPDVIIAQEFISEAALDDFRTILNSAAGSPGDWENAAFSDGNDTDNVFLYRTSKVTFLGQTIVSVGGGAPNHPRDVNRYDIRPVGYAAPTTTIACYSSHMKAGTSGSDEDRREVEAIAIRNDAESLPAAWTFLLGGDLNVKTSSDPGYVELTSSQSINAGRFFDPIVTPGNWNNSSQYRFVHSQDPVGAGGMDDRFDFVLVSSGLTDGEGVDYIGNPAIPYSTTSWSDPNHSYRTWGNDGTSFNSSLTITGNSMVGSAIASALRDVANGAGHLPVLLDLQVPAVVAGDTVIDFGAVPQDSVAIETLHVFNAGDTVLWTAAGIDDLDYTLAGTSGVTVAPGPYSDPAGGGGNDHAVQIDTSVPGPFSGAVLVASDAADEPSRFVSIFAVIEPAAEPCPADFDGSGTVAFADLLTLLGAWGPCPGCPEDLSGNGLVDFADVLELLGAWGPCP